MMHAMWVEGLGWTLLHFLWQGVLISAVYAAARRYAARPEHRYLLACVALAAMMAAPLVTFAVMRPDVQLSAGPYLVATPLASSVPSAASTVVNMLPVAAGAWPGQFLTWIVVVWLAGAAAFWMRLMGGWVVAARMRSTLVRPAPPEWQRTLDSLKARIGLSLPVRLLISALVQVPSVVGWIRPVVLVPVGALTGLPPDHMEALLMHELAHIRRRDYLVNMLQGVAESLLFYHPAVWWVSGHIRTERELCCDDVAVSAGGGELIYARALAELESFRPAHFHTAIAANGASLTHRIARLLGQSPTPTRTLSGPGVAVCAALLAVTACAVFGQSAPAPKFEVASIKPSPPGQRPSMGVSPGGRFTATNETLKYFIQFAYNVQDYQISGGPGWIDSTGYDIVATPERSANPNPDNIGYFRRMLQGLLEKRFKLTLQHTKKELPEYALVVSRGGSKLTEREKWKDATDMRLGGGKGRMIGQQVTMALVAQNLSARVGRPVEDDTGLKGYYDFRLEWTPDESDSAPPGDSASAPSPSDHAGPSIFTAIQEQLGLKLVPTKGPSEFLVIDHVERPTEN